MRWRVTAGLVVVALLFAGLLGPRPDHGPAGEQALQGLGWAPQGASKAGDGIQPLRRVLDHDGRPIPNATAMWTTGNLAVAWDGLEAAATLWNTTWFEASADGAFALPAPGPGWRLRAQAPGHYPLEVAADTLELRLTPRGNFTVLGHRGASAYAPENTLAALDLAAALGADRVEVDVRMTIDEHLVVIHDALVDRTTDGRGAVATMTLAQLRAFDAGSWFHADYAGQRIPTLIEVLEWSTEAGLPLLVEVKEEAPRDALALSRTIETIAAYTGRLHDSWLASFNPTVGHSCAWLRQWRCGWILGTEPDQRPMAESLAEASRVPFLVVPVRFIDADFVDRAHNQSLQVLAYTANGESTLRSLLATGVDGILTDRPERLVRLLRPSPGAT